MRILVGFLIVICAITIGFVKSSELTGRYNTVTRFFAGLGTIDEINTILGLENKAARLKGDEHYNQAIDVYDDIINGTWHSKEKRMIEEVISRVYLQKVDILKKLKQYNEIPIIVDEQIIRFKNSSNSKIQRHIAQAYLEKMFAFTEQKKSPEEILSVCEDMRNHFNVSDSFKIDPNNMNDPNFSKHYNQLGAGYFVETMMLYEAIQLEKINELEKAQIQINKLTQLLSPISSDGLPFQSNITSHMTNTMIEYLGASQEDSVQNIISTALLDLGNVEVSHDQPLAAKEAYTKIVDLYRNSLNPEVQIRVQLASDELKKLSEKKRY